ncbi:MAG: protein-disulfide reductase DsbD domain-containing protein [Gemmatimonadales bacterium]
MRAIVVVTLMAVVSACSAPKEAPIQSASNVVEWVAEAAAMRPGPDNSTLIDVEVRATIGPGWHVYSLTQLTGGPTPMTVKVEPSPPYTLAGDVKGPAPVKAPDREFGIETETYSGAPAFHVPVKLAGSASVSPPPLEIKVRSQACSDKLCLPARTTTLTVYPEQGST